MSKPGLSFGLNFSKKSGASKPAPPKRKPLFGGGDDSDDDATPKAGSAQAVGDLELDDFDSPAPQAEEPTKRKPKAGKNALPIQPPPALKAKKGQESTMFGDLSSALSSKRNAEAAEELDPSVYDYDKVYDTFKPQSHKKADGAGAERKPRYMSSVIAAANVRKRDALIAEEKKIAREREAEGDEYAGKEKFVTEAYKRQQEENRRLEEEEKRREEEEAKKNKTGGMNAFYKGMLNKGEERHREMMQAAEEKAKQGSAAGEEQKEDDEQKDVTDADKAREINSMGGAIAVNEEGQVVDKRQLLRGGLNVDAKKEARAQKDSAAARERQREEERRRKEDASKGAFIGAGGKGAMRERQTRMLEQQLEAALKRTRDDEEKEREKIERASKSRKTEGEISSAKERYLARKREAEEAKKKGGGAA